MPKLLIYPEGCSTNNNYVIQFKKGAFVGEAAIKPVSSKYGGTYFSMSGDVIDMLSHFVFITSQPLMQLHLKEYPTFVPNEYFWRNHWDQKSGEERWEAYARVMREVIAYGHDFTVSDLSMEDKLYYKK